MAIKTASVAFDGVGDLSVSAGYAPWLILEGVGDLSASARVSPWLNLEGEGDLSVSASRVRSGSVAYQGVPDLRGTARRVRSASVGFEGVGDLEVTARAIHVAYAQHIHRADAEYGLQQRADVTRSLERAIEGTVYEEGRERQFGRRDTGEP